MTCMVESASACGGIDAVPRRRSTDEARESGVEDRSGTCADGREAGAFGRSGPEAAIDGATLRVRAADHAAGGPRRRQPSSDALGVHRGLEDVAEPFDSPAARGRPFWDETRRKLALNFSHDVRGEGVRGHHDGTRGGAVRMGACEAVGEQMMSAFASLASPVLASPVRAATL